MKMQMILLLAVLLSATVSCDKDDEQPYYPVNTANNKYTFQDKTIAITDAEYYFADGDTFLFFKGEGVADYVTIIFANRDGEVPIGAYTYHGDRNSGYIVEGNFWRGNITNASTPYDWGADGGSVIITSEPGGMHKVSFVLVTPGDTARGEYTGVIRPRG